MTIEKAVHLDGFFYGRGERARTFDLAVPNRTRYQLRHTPRLGFIVQDSARERYIDNYDIITVFMKYISIFFTILLIWIAVILMAFTRSSQGELFDLYLTVITSTLILFLIGFARK